MNKGVEPGDIPVLAPYEVGVLFQELDDDPFLTSLDYCSGDNRGGKK